jgi:hypothetical protein
MALPVWTADADHFTVDDPNHTADGWHIHVSEEIPVGAGGEDPKDKERRYRLITAQKEEQMILMIVKSYMKNIY